MYTISSMGSNYKKSLFTITATNSMLIVINYIINTYNIQSYISVKSVKIQVKTNFVSHNYTCTRTKTNHKLKYPCNLFQ